MKKHKKTIKQENPAKTKEKKMPIAESNVVATPTTEYIVTSEFDQLVHQWKCAQGRNDVAASEELRVKINKMKKQAKLEE